MTDSASFPYHGLYLFLILVAVASVIVNKIVERPFQSTIVAIWIAMLIFTFLLFGNERLISKKILPHVRTSPKVGEPWLQPLDELDVSTPEEIDDEKILGFIENALPKGATLLMTILFTSLLIYDFSIAYSVNNQSYGLLLDGVGGLILSIDALRMSVFASSVSLDNRLKESIERFWGFSILGLGFFLQLLHLLMQSI